MLIGATRCGVKFENTVLLRDTTPSGNERACDAETATDDISEQVKCYKLLKFMSIMEVVN